MVIFHSYVKLPEGSFIILMDFPMIFSISFGDFARTSTRRLLGERNERSGLRSG
jgi:hypothetical protein